MKIKILHRKDSAGQTDQMPEPICREATALERPNKSGKDIKIKCFNSVNMTEFVNLRVPFSNKKVFTKCTPAPNFNTVQCRHPKLYVFLPAA